MDINGVAFKFSEGAWSHEFSQARFKSFQEAAEHAERCRVERVKEGVTEPHALRGLSTSVYLGFHNLKIALADLTNKHWPSIIDMSTKSAPVPKIEDITTEEKIDE